MATLCKHSWTPQCKVVLLLKCVAHYCHLNFLYLSEDIDDSDEFDVSSSDESSVDGYESEEDVSRYSIFWEKMELLPSPTSEETSEEEEFDSDDENVG